MGHRVVLLNELLGRFSPRVTRWPTHGVDPLATYTTSRDANCAVPGARYLRSECRLGRWRSRWTRAHTERAITSLPESMHRRVRCGREPPVRVAVSPAGCVRHAAPEF